VFPRHEEWSIAVRRAPSFSPVTQITLWVIVIMPAVPYDRTNEDEKEQQAPTFGDVIERILQ
jgi:hypothetical protein